MRLKTAVTALVFIAAAWTSLCSAAYAGEGGDGSKQLSSLLNRFDSFSASFDQVSAGSESRRMEQSRGTLVLAKPNRFNWVAQEPFAQQLVSDGEYLWVYDPDLEQATRRPLDTDQNGVPALILNGQIEQLRQSYSIRLIHQDADSQLFELRPFDEQSVFTRIRLLFKADLITELQLEDSLGQRTSVLFQDQQLNPVLSATAFSFVPPEGIDVIIEGAEEEEAN